MAEQAIQPENPTALQASPSEAIPRQDILTAAKGGGIFFAGNLFGYVGRFVFSIVVARIIGAGEFGLYSLGLTVATTCSALASLGLGVAMVRYVPIAVRQRDEAGLWGVLQVGFALPLSLALIIGSAVFLLAEPIANLAFKEPDLVPVLRLMSLGIPIGALRGIAGGVTQGFKKPRINVVADSVAFHTAKVSVALMLLAIGLGTMGVVVGHVFASALALVFFIYFIHGLFPLNRPLRPASHKRRELLRFSLPVYLGQLIGKLGLSFETLVLGFLGMTAGVGVYTAALRLSEIGNLFFLSVVSIAAPIISDLSSQREIVQLKRFFQTTAKWSMTFNLPVLLTLVLFAKPLLSLFGSDFVPGTAGLMILAFGAFVRTSAGPCPSMIDMTGHSKLNFVNSVFFLAVTLGLDLLFIPPLGVVGAAIAASLAVTLLHVLHLVEVYYLFRMLPYNLSFLKPITAGLVAAGVTYLIKQQLTDVALIWQLAVGVPLIWGVYALVVVLLGFSEEDRLVIDRLSTRLGLKGLLSDYLIR